MGISQGDQLPLDRCPHCSVARPLLSRNWGPARTASFSGHRKRAWSGYKCHTCGGIVMVCSPEDESADVTGIFPEPPSVEGEVPERAGKLLEQAIASIHAPAGL